MEASQDQKKYDKAWAGRNEQWRKEKNTVARVERSTKETGFVGGKI